ncbi:succinate--CoA ligase subunit beta, partial [Aquimarina celericrescens]|nr:succinate--CoA ligase subunit beta [Aquimarina celericrescens]
AFKLILKDEKVEAILINIFGGIVRCVRVAEGIIEAYKNMGDQNTVPIIVRLQGTNAEKAVELNKEAGINVKTAVQFKEAADKVQEVLA